MVPISSVHNKKVRDAIRLHTSRGRKQQNRIIIFGIREILRAVEAGLKLVSLFVNSEKSLPKALSGIDTEITIVTENVFQKLAYGNRADGIVAIAARPEKPLDQFQASQGLVVVIESIEKPGNLGAIFRTADATGVGGIIVSDPGCDLFNPNAIRNSTGTVFSVPSAVASNEETISWLNQNDYRTMVATPDEADDLFHATFCDRCAVVLGSEAHGVSNTWMQGSFSRIRLPMNGVADSLNVSVTAAVIMYEALRQRTKPS